MGSAATLSKSDIIALEKSYWDAMKRKDGAKTAELSAKTSLVTGAHGMRTIAKDKMGQMTESGDWTLESYDFDDIEVATPTPDVAIIAYTVNQKCTINGKTQDIRAADSSTWIRGANGWECHAHSESLLTGGTPA